MENPFVKLFAIDFKDHLEVKKSGNTELKYVSWAYAWAEVKKLYPSASYEVKKFNGLPYVYDPITGFMVYTTVTIEGVSHEMWLPVLDGANKAINEYLMTLAKEQIKLAFEQSEKEVADLHQRTREGLLTARLNGKQVGRKKGVGFETKKAREAKQIIRTHCKTFGGTLDDAECMKLTGLARNTYYKYRRQIRAELMAEQDLPKGASIFYEPPKSF